MFSISEHPIDVGKLLANVKDDSAGATVLFLGTVRDHSDDYMVSGIYYEAYVRMAEEAMAKIEAESVKKWSLKKIATVHRIGNLKIGEVSVAIAISSEHRAEAFEAGRYAIDRIKSEVPIWKKEIISGEGGMWAKGTPLGES
ncbi:MAG TPA: molybdenum cofactor biosynthesis protein MoaE [Nitrososphaera sp.]|jgi:molybdopterin synthase catalytic subunit|nr:molybdenum cofactor biosynthesis protein MoaE [Nitrososphaera sp.]HZB79845.1 molybdenum cofactor biosynthesis protein MoaE [Nitrososphaera sp.]